MHETNVNTEKEHNNNNSDQSTNLRVRNIFNVLLVTFLLLLFFLSPQIKISIVNRCSMNLYNVRFVGCVYVLVLFLSCNLIHVYMGGKNLTRSRLIYMPIINLFDYYHFKSLILIELLSANHLIR